MQLYDQRLIIREYRGGHDGDHAPFDVNRQVVLKVLNSRIFVNQGPGVSWSKCLMADLNTLDILYNEYVIGKYINRQIMMAVPKVILFVHKNGRI